MAHEYTDDVMCPHCDKAQTDAINDTELSVDGQQTEWTCEHCKKPMLITVTISYSYSTEAHDAN